MHRLANPNRFLRIITPLHPWLAAVTLLLLAAGLYLAWFGSPADYRQGETVRIMYVHVPAAWMALFVYSVIASSSFVFLVWKHPVADIVARSSGPIGMAFALLTLITGALWGKPMWGAWWVWDARLTSMLILFFLYAGYVTLSAQVEQDSAMQKSCAVLALVGFINIPVIKFSVDWWHTLHQPASVFRLDGPAIDGSMLTPLLVMALGFMAFYLTVAFYGIRLIVARSKLYRLRMLKM